ncbi:MAG TPA: hypothetical protein VIU11_26280 [Nakamurella sp.]
MRVRRRLSWLSGLAAFLGGAAWTVKGIVILAVGEQPPLLFEMGPPLFGVGLLGVASSTMPAGRRRTAALTLGAASFLAALVALVIDRAGEFNPALVVSSLSLLVGLLTVPRHAAWPAPLAWWIGFAWVPAMLIGGVLSELDERLLEVPLTCLGIAWMTVGWALLRQPAVDPDQR